MGNGSGTLCSHIKTQDQIVSTNNKQAENIEVSTEPPKSKLEGDVDNREESAASPMKQSTDQENPKKDVTGNEIDNGSSSECDSVLVCSSNQNASGFYDVILPTDYSNWAIDTSDTSLRTINSADIDNEGPNRSYASSNEALVTEVPELSKKINIGKDYEVIHNHRKNRLLSDPGKVSKVHPGAVRSHSLGGNKLHSLRDYNEEYSDGESLASGSSNPPVSSEDEKQITDNFEPASEQKPVISCAILNYTSPAICQHHEQTEREGSMINLPFKVDFGKDTFPPSVLINQSCQHYIKITESSVNAVSEQVDASTSMYVCQGDNSMVEDYLTQLADHQTLKNEKLKSKEIYRSASIAVALPLMDRTESEINRSYQRSQSTCSLMLNDKTYRALSEKPRQRMSVNLDEEEEVLDGNASDEESDASSTIAVRLRTLTEQQKGEVDYENPRAVADYTTEPTVRYKEDGSILNEPYAVDVSCEGHIFPPDLDKFPQNSERRLRPKAASVSVPQPKTNDHQCLAASRANKQRRLTEVLDSRPTERTRHHSLFQRIGSQMCCNTLTANVVPLEGPGFLRVSQSADVNNALNEEEDSVASNDDNSSTTTQREHLQDSNGSTQVDCVNYQSDEEFHYAITDKSERKPRPIHLGVMDKLLPRSYLYY